MIGDHEFKQIRALLSPGEPHPLSKFFLDPHRYFRESVDRCLTLGLRDIPRRWILDVGSAIPYFAAAAELFGHDCMNIDVEDMKVYQAAKILGCDFIPHHVSVADPLPPNLPHPFDLITVYGVNFHSVSRMPDLVEIVKELIQHLNPGGKVILRGNNGWLDDKWQRLYLWRRVVPSSRIRLIEGRVEFTVR